MWVDHRWGNEASYNEKTAILECSRKYSEPPLLNLELSRESTDAMNTPVASKTYVFYGLDRDLKEMLHTISPAKYRPHRVPRA